MSPKSNLSSPLRVLFRPQLLLVLSCVAAPVSSIAVSSPDLAQIDFFEKKIRPVLAASCYECHSAKSDKIKGGLRLDTKEGVLKGGDSGETVIPGNPKSLLLQVLRHETKDPEMAMPPKKDKLSAAVIADFEAWVKMGAPDPRDSGAELAKDVNDAKAADHWAFKAVTHPAIPATEDPLHFVRNPIDSFVLARLKENRLAPSPMADKPTLLRRVTYDLTGLPPTLQEVEDFVSDTSPSAFEKVVDRLLASPSYGERWGRHWLDIARYADTSGDRQNGKARLTVYPSAWTYRDYVINAFNKDLPYDRFILEQIAADRLPEARQDHSALAALGFLTVGKRFMGNENDLLDDRIDVVTKGLMGLTGACARCHDHKFDPIPTKDYYALHGVFASSEEPVVQPVLQDPAANPAYRDFQSELVKIEQEAKAYMQLEGARLVGGLLERTGDYLSAAREAVRTNDTSKKGGNFRLSARAKGLKPEVAAMCLDQLTLAYARNKKKADPLFGPWFALSELSEDQFVEKACSVLEAMRTAGSANIALLNALEERVPSSMTDVALVYNELFTQLHKALALPEYAGYKAAKRGGAFPLERTLVAMKDVDMELLRKDVFGRDSTWLPEERILAKTLGAAFANAQAATRGKISALELTHPGAPVRAMTLADKGAPKDSPVLIRGEAENRGPVVPRHFLTLLGGSESRPFTDGSGRLELARAIASRDNPLTARVIVNRVWQWHFGQAIVRTVSDFGTRSEPPTHPELIDWLANYLMDHNWSLKQLTKLIVMSATYQQDSCPSEQGLVQDPTNQWLWRFNVQRLDFEAVRDTLLTVGAQLETAPLGGRPFQLAGESSLPSDRKNRFTGVDTSALTTSPNRRSVYALIDRAGLPEMFNTFDFANPDMSTGERVLTTVPQQSLFMMNSPFVATQVRNLLKRSDFPSDGSIEERVRFIFATALQRPPTSDEIQLAQRFIEAESQTATENKPVLNGNVGSVGLRKAQPEPKSLTPWERYAQVVLLTNEVMFVR
jgi:hypothetical protein